MLHSMSRARWIAALVCLGVLAIALHAGVINNQLTYDDHWAIERNPNLDRPWDLRAHFGSGFWGPGWESKDSAWRPATTLTLAWSHSVHGETAAGYFLVNLLLHALAAVFLAMLARALGLSAPFAFAAGALFAVHPVHVEAIASGVGRADLLMGAAAIGALLLWERKRTWPALAALALAALAKEMGVMIALVMVWREWTRTGALSPPRGERWWRWLLPLGVLVAYLVCRYLVLGGLGNAQPTYLENPIADAAIGTRLLTAADIYGRALRLMVAPVTLLYDYGYATIPPVTGLTFGAAVGGVLLIATAALTILSARRSPALSVMLALWLGPYLLVSHLGPTLPMIFAERVLYLPSAGLCLAAAFGLQWVARGQWSRAGVAALLGLSCLAYAGRSALRVGDWQNDETLYTSTVEDAPRGVKALTNAARYLYQDGDPSKAVATIQRALSIYEADARPHMAAATIYTSIGDEARAVAHLDRAAELKPEDSTFTATRCVFAARFHPRRAITECRAATEVRYALPESWVYLGVAYDKNGHREAAEQAFRTALSRPRGATRTALYNYGVFLARQRRFEEARELLEAAHHIAPENEAVNHALDGVVRALAQ